MEGQPVDEYVDLLIREMELRTEGKELETIETVFVGGGTPTTLTPKQIEKLCEAVQRIFPLSKEVEFTFESNPGDLSVEKLRAMQDSGVNRLSMGVQSFNQELLKKNWSHPHGRGCL